MGFWHGRSVLVTGGASFIGSHIAEELVERGARVRVADNFSSGRRGNLSQVQDEVEILEGDLKDPNFAERVVTDQEVMVHLAADHGGRGYVDLHQVACGTNLGLDQITLRAAIDAGIEKVVYASSGCVYPLQLQTNPHEEVYLTEDMVGPPYWPDGMYGLAKLAGELMLKHLHDETGLSTASCRYFTVYGPRGLENHAVMAMIARAFIGEDPFVVWGTGDQIRNWTYVSDIAEGTIRAAESIDDGTAVNLGTMERVKVLDAVQQVLRLTAHTADIRTRPEMPTGPMNRVADNTLARKLLEWEPQVYFAEGLAKTVEWYFATKDQSEVRKNLDVLLTERPPAQSSSPNA